MKPEDDQMKDENYYCGNGISGSNIYHSRN